MLWPRYVSSSTLASLCQLPGSCVEMPGLQTWEIFGWLVSLAKADWERMRLAIDPIIICQNVLRLHITVRKLWCFRYIGQNFSCCWRHRQGLRTLLLCSLGHLKTNEAPDANQGHSRHSIKSQQKFESGAKAKNIHICNMYIIIVVVFVVNLLAQLLCLLFRWWYGLRHQCGHHKHLGRLHLGYRKNKHQTLGKSLGNPWKTLRPFGFSGILSVAHYLAVTVAHSGNVRKDPNVAH